MFGKRLEILADRLESIAACPVVEREFNLCDWYAAYECGTTACAMGEACLIPEFQTLGLHLRENISSASSYPVFENSAGRRAAAEFFDIPLSDTEYLFFASEYARQNDPLVVANRLRAFVARGGRPPSGKEEFVPLCHTSGVNLISTLGVSICPRV